MKIVTLNDLERRYYDGKSDLDSKTHLLFVKNALINIKIECFITQDMITTNISLLQMFSLNKTIFGLLEEHIDLVIENKKCEYIKS